jgi:hypothetical protein
MPKLRKEAPLEMAVESSPQKDEVSLWIFVSVKDHEELSHFVEEDRDPGTCDRVRLKLSKDTVSPDTTSERTASSFSRNSPALR